MLNDETTREAVDEGLMIIEAAARALTDPGPKLDDIQQEILRCATDIRGWLHLEEEIVDE